MRSHHGGSRLRGPQRPSGPLFGGPLFGGRIPTPSSMFGWLRWLRRLLGPTLVQKRLHPSFGRMWFWPEEDGPGYWEAEPTVDGRRIGITFHTDASGPTAEHERFLRWADAEPDGLFELAREALVPAYEGWVGAPFPASWREAFVLAGMELPDRGDRSRPWSVCYDCLADRSGHQFRVEMRGGQPASVSVDG